MTLREKALEAAIKQMKRAKTRDEANKAYLLWKVFHNDKFYMAAVSEKQKEFKSKNRNNDR